MLAAGAVSASDTITTSMLLDEMVDLDRLASFPDPAFTCRQFSSYDRGAKSPDENWFANRDRGFHLREEKKGDRTEYVMMDADGPGAIVRIWSANPMGKLRFYIDGADTPAWTVDQKLLLEGAIPPFRPPIGGMRSRGCNLYFPILYAKHMKVTCDKKDFYYQINYRTYEAGTKVESFSQGGVKRLSRKINETAEKLKARTPAGPSPDALRSDYFYFDLKPGEKVSAEQPIPGPAAIRYIALTVQSPDLEKTLRGVIVKGYFDDFMSPCILSPLGDLFGSAPGINPTDTLPMTMEDGKRLVSRWIMPFGSQAFFELENLTDTPVTISGQLCLGEWKWTKRSMHFHAKWRGERNIPTRPFKDWNFIDCKGQGVFVGDCLTLANPVTIWWGEGDEKIYVDGETFPSHFGTGTEDYFGYAWGSPELFSHAYHTQSRCDGPGTYGWVSLNRLHLIDCIPFTRSFRFDMEIWHWRDVKVDYAATSYWYAKPGCRDSFAMPKAEDLVLRKIEEYAGTKKVKGAIEGETMKVVSVDGEAAVQDLSGHGVGWSGGRHLWWTEGKVGDSLKLVFKAKEAGTCVVTANLTKAVDYGIIRVAINGQEAGKDIDLYNDGVIPFKTKLGTFSIKKGGNSLVMTIVGTNPKAVKKYMAGLDYLLLEKK